MSLGIFVSKLLFILALVLLIFYMQLIIGQVNYQKLSYWCADETMSDDGSSYTSNLNKLLDSLPSEAGKSINNGFFATNTSQMNLSGSEPIYGLLLCRGDTTSDSCKGCVHSAITNLPPEECGSTKSAVIWYDKCMVRYSNESFLKTINEGIFMYYLSLYNVSSTSDVNKFMGLIGDTVLDLASSLSSSEDRPELFKKGVRKYFLTKQVPFDNFIRLYIMVQCTLDLVPVDCGRCLNLIANKLPNCCDGSMGARLLNPSCYARYETYPFDYSTPQEPQTSTPPTTLAKGQSNKSRPFVSVVNILLGILVLILVVLVSILVFFLCKKRKENIVAEGVRTYKRRSDAELFEKGGEDFTIAESLEYDFTTLRYATNNFCEFNKLGEGGFGIVYKGMLPDNGEEVAIKRLSKGSYQGVEQSKNEMVFVAKLQHRNLVRLLGYCSTSEEMLLVYEFVPNKSLDVILYDHETSRRLDWSARYKIIHGIARGMLYLHEDSRVKIIHRDLKASNILLDEDLNPKISDFGLARNFTVDQSQDLTNIVAGTFGYMAPEYIEYGEISTKSDVYSFGVLVLEILSGKKISDRRSMFPENLLTYSWRHLTEGTPLEVVDVALRDSFSSNEVIRCLHLGLLCVQEDMKERPSMLSVVFYLNSNFDLPAPEKPSFKFNTQKELYIQINPLKRDQALEPTVG